MQMQKIPLEQIMEISLDEYIQLMKKSGGGVGDGSGGVVGNTTSTPMMVDGPNSTNKSENQLVIKSKLQKLMDLPKPTSQQWRFMSPNTPNNPVGMPPLISIESHNLYENKFAANRNWSMNKLNNYFQQNKTKSKNKRRNRKRINNNQGMQHQFQNNIKNNNNNNNNKQFNGIRNGYNKQQNGNQNRSNNGQRFRKSVQSRLTLFQNNEEDTILGTNLYNNNQNQQNYNNNNNNLLSMRRNSFNNFKSNSINGLNNIDDDDDDDEINQLAMTNGGGGKKMSVTNPMTTIAKHNNNNNNNNNNNGLKTTDQLSTINFDKHLVTTLAAKIVHQMNNVQKNEQIHKSKYDMKIQKEISDIQGKTLFFKCPGASVVSFDGPGIDAYLTTPDATEITMNQRFS